MRLPVITVIIRLQQSWLFRVNALNLMYPATLFQKIEMTTRRHSEVYLLGQPACELSKIRLPSNGEVMRLFLHLHLTLGQQQRQAAASIVEKVLKIWDKARVPTCRKDNAIPKLEQLHKAWTNLKKHKDRPSQLHAIQEEQFRDKMKNLFDIAHAEALTMIKIEEDRNFLIAQREPGRRGYLGPVDTALAEKESRKAQRLQLEKEM